MGVADNLVNDFVFPHLLVRPRIPPAPLGQRNPNVRRVYHHHQRLHCSVQNPSLTILELPQEKIPRDQRRACAEIQAGHHPYYRF